MSINEHRLENYMEGMVIHSKYYATVYDLHLKECYSGIKDKIYRNLRETFRFKIMQDYTINFVDKYINSYEDLLQFGRYVLDYLHQHKNESWIDSPTAVEESLYKVEDSSPERSKRGELSWPVLQMIELNKYIYTTASTNHPTELFQNMFVYAEIKKCDLPVIIQKLSKTDLDYNINELELINETKFTPEPPGLEKKAWIKDIVEIHITDPILERRNLYTRLVELLKD